MNKRDSNRADRRWTWWLASLLCGLMLLSGCQSAQKASGTSHSASKSSVKSPVFGELNLLLVPYGLSPKGGIRMEAVALQVYAVKPGKAKGSSITEGELEVSLYDGFQQSTDDPPLKFLQSWKYTPEDLKPLAKESLLGVGYQILLVWDQDKKPEQRKVTVQAVYKGADGQELRSDAGVITLGL